MEKNKGMTSLLILLFIAVAVTFALYGIFYHFSAYIWSLNANVPLDELAPWIRGMHGQRDGMETYALYVLVLADIFIVALLAKLAERLKIGRYEYVFWPVFALVSFIMLIYFRRRIGFHPPDSDVGTLGIAALVVGAAALLLWAIVRISGRRRRLADLLIVLGLLPVCFVATQPFSYLDYAYVFSPSLRLIDHFKLSDIYFQYDLLLSLIAAAWLKLKLDLNAFQVVAQASFYALFLACFFSSRRFFRAKKLSYCLLAALVLVKVYALGSDPVADFQVTPLRLDLWIILFIIGYEKGIYSKWLGAALGALIVLHPAFGIIYAAGYLEMVATAWLLDCLRWPISWPEIKGSVMRHFRFAWPNALFVAVSLGCSYALFQGSFLEASSTYRKIGIGFLTIYHQSFYWYVPILLALVFTLLIKKRAALGDRYFQSGLFLIFLAIGESLYFFGRSDEHNIINISAVLLFAAFMLLDLVFSDSAGLGRSIGWKWLAAVLPVLLVVSIAYFYSARIETNMGIQYRNLAKGQLIYPMPIQVGPNVLLPVVGDSQKVYFMTGCEDFYYYYSWNYVPQGHFLPFCSWVYEKDVVNFVQGLINDNYYVVVRDADVEGEQETLGELKYGHSVQQEGFQVMWK